MPRAVYNNVPPHLRNNNWRGSSQQQKVNIKPPQPSFYQRGSSNPTEAPLRRGSSFTGQEGFSKLGLLGYITLMGLGAGTMEHLYKTNTSPHVQEQLQAKGETNYLVHEYGIPMGIGAGAGLALSLILHGIIAIARGGKSKVPPEQILTPSQETIDISMPRVSVEEALPAPQPAEHQRRITAPVGTPTFASKLSDENGLLLGKYGSVRFIGAGGMGEVYAASQVVIERKVAIKVIKEADVDNISRFMDEARVLAALSDDHNFSPHIVRLYDFDVRQVRMNGDDKTETVLYMVMEYIEGRDLKKEIRTHGSFETLEALNIFYRIVQGLDYAAGKGIIHRDVKLENIMLMDKDPYVKILDFGLAKGPGTSHKTQEGNLAGTPQYIAPERLWVLSDPRIKIDFRSDIYSLGVVLYAMLIGRLPFSSMEHLSQETTDIRQINAKVPERVWLMIKKMLMKRPEQRQQSYPELLAEIETCISEING